ncbi:MAG: serine--tRNA ligase, partial [Planctomycetes bacterium]|nr:serine--tRNA ligase [Planctomycetota bacterium]
MIDIKRVEKNPEAAAELLGRKGVEKELIARLLAKVDDRRKAQQNKDNTRAEANKIAKSISKLFKEGKKSEAEHAKLMGAELKVKVAEYDAEFSRISDEINDLLLNIPNFPDADTPVGKSEEDNVTLRIEGYNAEDYIGREFLHHWEIAEKLGLFDIERAAKTTGSMSVIFKGNG